MNFSENINPGMYDGDIDINITNSNLNDNTNTNMNTNYNDGMMGGAMMGGTMCPIVETPRERVVYRNIYHTVPHV